jgi:nucleotide-binding universal stress UspA family protein
MKILKKIILAQDFTSTSKNLESVAISMAKIFNSTVVPLHVLPDDIINLKVKDFLKVSAHEKLQKISNNIKDNGVSVDDYIIKYGAPHDGIIFGATDANANLILIGSGENSDQKKFKLGTTTERIIQNSEKPVLVIKENDVFSVKTILCPVDFSDPSKRALKNAIILSRRFNAHLIILSICEVPNSSWFTSAEDLKKENEERFKKHQKDFEDFLGQFNLNDLSWSKQDKTGNPSDVILDTINTNNVDFLIIGTAGKTALHRLVLGSVTEKVIREVPCSFLTLKSQDVISLHLETDIKDFETLFHAAQQLEKDGLYEESIEQYKASLSINTMHVPAYIAIAKLFDKINQPEKAAIYRKSANEIKERIWYSKIEEEVRKLRGS